MFGFSRRKNKSSLEVEVRFRVYFSLWDAFKLRLAGAEAAKVFFTEMFNELRGKEGGQCKSELSSRRAIGFVTNASAPKRRNADVLSVAELDKSKL